MSVHVYACVSVCVSVCVGVCMRVYVCACVPVCLFVSVRSCVGCGLSYRSSYRLVDNYTIKTNVWNVLLSHFFTHVYKHSSTKL